MFHKDFPWGKGVWISQLKECLGGDTDAIIQKCHDYDISYLIIRSGDGVNDWAQFTPELVEKLHAANIKVYSWSYVYGDNPAQEAEVAIRSLDKGVDGHVFVAEGEYERLENNADTAEFMLHAVCSKYPDKFLAYSTYALIDYHTRFPYLTFGKYCDAVMPQVYFGLWGKTPQEAILSMYDNFVRWQRNWINDGHEESVKRIIPVTQAWDSYESTPRIPPYTLSPADITSFVKAVSAYKSVSFWEFSGLVRADCWAAIHDAAVEAPTQEERGITVPQTQEQLATALPDASEGIQESAPLVQDTLPEEAAPAALDTSSVPDDTSSKTGNTVDTPQEQAPVTTLPATVPITKPTTIVVKPNGNHPDGVEVTMYVHKTHREYFIEAVRYLWLLLKSKFSKEK